MKTPQPTASSRPFARVMRSLPCPPLSVRPPVALFTASLCCLLSATLAPRSHAQAAPAPTGSAADAKSVEVNVMDEFKVFDKKPVPFTDANMDIPRGINDVQAYYVISSEEIEATGKANLDEALRDSLTQNTAVEMNSQIDPNNQSLLSQLGATSSINLRGLGSSQTLILINGQRTSNFANRGVTYQPDMNGYPLAAIERVEVLPSSASAIYGGTAVGGVVNVILKRNYQGGQVSATYQNTFDTDAPLRTISGIYGFSVGNSGKTHVTLSGSYSDGKPLRLQDRPFIIDYYKRAIANSPGTFYTQTQPYWTGTTPNIALNTAAVNGFTNAQTASLTLKATGQPIGSRFTYIPPGTSDSTPAATLAAGLAANAGKYNLDLAPSVFRGYQSLLTHVTRKEAVMARIDHQLTKRISLFADFSFNKSEILEAQWVPIGNGVYQFAIPGNAPTNPFRENVMISIPIPASQATHNDVTNQVSNGVVGAVVKLPWDWRVAADVNYSVSAQKLWYGLGNFANSTQFGAYQPLFFNGTINPFVDTIANPVNWEPYYGEWVGYNKDTMLDYNLRASGPFLSLPAGRPVLTVGSEVYTERLPAAFVGGTFPPVPPAARNPSNQYSFFTGQRISTYAGHAEISVPIVSGQNEKPFIRGLEFQAAVRTEYFEVYTNPDARVNLLPDAIPPRETHSAVISRQDIAKLHATKPTFGLKYQPLREITLRASYAEAFLPPTFGQLTQRVGTAGVAPSVPTALFFDPVTNSTYSSFSVAGNNPDLGPETSKNWNYGVIFEPHEGPLRDFRLNVEYWRINKMNLIRNVNNVQQLANMGDRAPAGSVERDPTTKQIALFTFANYNVGDGMTDGWDISVDYRKATPIGAFAVRSRTTFTEHLKLPPAIGYPAIDYLDYPNSGGANKLKSNASIGWSSGKHLRASWSTIYYSGYNQAGSPGDPVYLGVANPTLITTSTGPQGGTTIPSQVYHNVMVGYNFGARDARGWLRGLSVQVTVNNVFDTKPPFDAAALNGRAPFFYSRYGNVRLRDYILRVKKDF